MAQGAGYSDFSPSSLQTRTLSTDLWLLKALQFFLAFYMSSKEMTNTCLPLPRPLPFPPSSLSLTHTQLLLSPL